MPSAQRGSQTSVFPGRSDSSVDSVIVTQKKDGGDSGVVSLSRCSPLIRSWRRGSVTRGEPGDGRAERFAQPPCKCRWTGQGRPETVTHRPADSLSPQGTASPGQQHCSQPCSGGQVTSWDVMGTALRFLLEDPWDEWPDTHRRARVTREVGPWKTGPGGRCGCPRGTEDPGTGTRGSQPCSGAGRA